MLQRKEETSVDWITIGLYIVLMLCGWLSIYGASYDYENVKSIFDFDGRAGMQLIWIGTTLILGFIILKLDSSTFDTFAYLIYIALIGLLIVTIFIAPDIKGSRSWLVLGPIRLQPAEFAKFGVALALAKFMSSYNFKLLEVKNILTIALIIVLPMVLILLQKETGSALVYTVFVLVLYREGLPGIILFIAAAAIVMFVFGLKYSEIDWGLLSQGEVITSILLIICSAGLIKVYTKYSYRIPQNILLGCIAIFGISYLLELSGVINVDWGIVSIIALVATVVYLIFALIKHWSTVYLWVIAFIFLGFAYVGSIDYIFNDVLQPHQQLRIKVALGMEDDLMGAGYNVNQSKIAIGSGGIIGKGFLNGTQTKLKYVPEQDTDFIFCTVGEEQGFLGSFTVIILFLALILRLIYLAERQREAFGRIYGYSVACILFFHIAINIGMVIGLTPVIGIPLPFFSYGGSSLWGFSILLFIFLNLDAARKRR